MISLPQEIESYVISFAIISFFISWYRFGIDSSTLPKAVTNAVTAANVPIGILMLLGSAGLIDKDVVLDVMSNGWMLFYSGAMLFGVGLIVIIKN